jgi:beta-mannanase
VARGARPMITWEPWDYQLGPNQPTYRLSTFRDGSHDAQIRRWAFEIAAWGQPLLLRFGHEMNGNWYPWSEQTNGNKSGDFRSAWQRVHRIFAAAGANNVQWVWSPNVEYAGSTPLPGLYPGDRDVDWVGVDGYNWGPYDPSKTWSSFASIFDPTLQTVRRLTTRPIMIAEVASTEIGGSKAAWITDFLHNVQNEAGVRAFIWFDENKEQDWRIRSSPEAATAFRLGLAELYDSAVHTRAPVSSDL